MRILYLIIVQWQCMAMSINLSNSEANNQESILVDEVLAHIPLEKCDTVIASPSTFRGTESFKPFLTMQYTLHNCLIFRHW